MEPLRGSDNIAYGVILLLMEPLRGSDSTPDGPLLLLMEPLRGSESIPGNVLNYQNIGDVPSIIE